MDASISLLSLSTAQEMVHQQGNDHTMQEMNEIEGAYQEQEEEEGQEGQDFVRLSSVAAFSTNHSFPAAQLSSSASSSSLQTFVTSASPSPTNSRLSMASRVREEQQQFYACLLHNFAFYAVPLTLGLLWGYMRRFLPNITLTWEDMRGWGLSEFLVLLVASFMVVPLLGFHLHLIARSSFAIVYAVSYAAVLFTLVVVSALAVIVVHDAVHIHHYFWALLFIPLFRFDTSPSCAAQAYLLGVHLDGLLRWGYAPLWYSP